MTTTAAATTDSLSTSIHLPSSVMCSQCSSMAHFACIEHCKGVFCGKCSVKHRTVVMKQMDALANELGRCRIDPSTTHDEIDANFHRQSQQALQRTHDTVKNLISQLQAREQTIRNEIKQGEELRQKERERRTDAALLTSEEAHDYTHLLNDCLRRDQLLDAETMTNIQTRLDARNALGQAVSETKTPVFHEGKLEVEKLLSLRFAPRAQSVQSTQRNRQGICVTVRLDKQKIFQSPLQHSFSVGRHPTAISLNDRYMETFFCRRTPGNSLILLSSTSIDFVNRGSGVELSIRLSKILGTMKDKFLAGTWCERTQRLILVGNHRIYVFDLQKQTQADRFLCEPAQGDPRNTPRFLNCTNDGSVFYAFKSGVDEYLLSKFPSPPVLPKESGVNDYEDSTTFFQPIKSTRISGRVAAMCVTHNRIALISRRVETEHISPHFFCLFNHKLERASENNVVQLPSDIKWITAITSHGNDDRYLLCDPRGQQLLLYQASGQVLTRRFRIGAINACCLTDGKLVLWLQKQYASSPTGKLHFITAPHLEDAASVAKSHPLLTKNKK